MTRTLDSATTLNTIDTMRAAVVTEFGAPLEICDLEVPTPGSRSWTGPVTRTFADDQFRQSAGGPDL